MFEILRLIFNIIQTKKESISYSFKEASESDIIQALKRIKNEFGDEIAKRVEKIFRLETAHFKSEAFKKTNSAGLLWNERYFKHRDKYCVYIKEIRDSKGNLIKNAIVPAGTEGAKKFCYVVFPTVYDGMRYLAIYLNKYGIDKGTARWGGGEKYLALVKKIQNKFV
jgi:hypothetical protein